jgi:hypothetical protein
MSASARQLKAQDSELDHGATSVAAGTERTCALTRKVNPVSSMIRFVLGPDETVVADVKRKLPGRGLWITANRTAVEDAVKRNIFAWGFKRTVRLGPNLAMQTEQLLERAALDALAIAAKAGVVIAGLTKVEAALARDEAQALLHASDGAADGRRKLDAALHRHTKTTDEITREIAVIDEFSGMQLDLALNRPNVVHAALLTGPGSETFLARVRRLQRFRTRQAPDVVSAPTERA